MEGELVKLFLFSKDKYFLKVFSGDLKRFEEEANYVALGMHTIYLGEVQKAYLNIY